MYRATQALVRAESLNTGGVEENQNSTHHWRDSKISATLKKTTDSKHVTVTACGIHGRHVMFRTRHNPVPLTKAYSFRFRDRSGVRCVDSSLWWRNPYLCEFYSSNTQELWWPRETSWLDFHENPITERHRTAWQFVRSRINLDHENSARSSQVREAPFDVV